MTFEDLNLHQPLLKAISDLGFTRPTTIQHKVFSVVMSGSDVCGIAQTGTGKTVAFLLPLLRMWTYQKTREPQVLILVPTRELVTQVVDNINQLSAYQNVVAKGVFGGTNMNTQKTEVEEGMDFLVATPGRFYDLAMAGAFKTRSIKKLVIDEVDEMLNLGFRPQLKNIFDLLPERRQNLLFSATLTTEVEDLISVYFNDPVKIEAAPTGTPVEKIKQVAYAVPNFYTKINLLKHVFASDGTMTKVLVFVATKKMADEVYDAIRLDFFTETGIIHSNKEQNFRFNAVKQFKEGTTRFLIATDLVARGIDVNEVSHVINFDIPVVAENYIHRIGRTGRADKEGVAIAFMTEKEKKLLEAIEHLMHTKVEVVELPAEVAIETRLTADETPTTFVREVQVRLPKKEESGPAFHEKSAKNLKMNKKVTRREQMKKKYGKPVTKRGKRQ